MLKIITAFLLCFILMTTFGQTQRKISTYLFAEYNKTLYDYTKGNNPSGIGLGLQTLFSNKTMFKPAIELTGAIHLENDKVFRLNPDGSTPENDNSVREMVNLFFGSSFHPGQGVYLSFLAGPSFINSQTLLGIKPSFGFYFSKAQRWTGKISYINIFNRTKITKNDFGSLSMAVGLILF
jgi:hypothetical protein